MDHVPLIVAPYEVKRSLLEKGFKGPLQTIPQDEHMTRALAADDDFIWYTGHPEAFEEYRGKHVAIWNKRVVGYGDSAREAYEMAKKNYPESEPTLAFIPREKELIL
jgi:hypothetical protein